VYQENKLASFSEIVKTNMKYLHWHNMCIPPVVESHLTQSCCMSVSKFSYLALS